MKTIQLTNDQWLVLVAVLDATQVDQSAHFAAQRQQELNHDVAPVAEGSEEENAIWEEILEGFDRIRCAI